MSWSGCLGVFLGPGQRDVQVGQDGALGACEVVQDGPGGGVGQVQAVEGGEGGDAGAGGGAQFGLDQPEDQQRDADDGDEGFDPVVVVQEHGPDPDGLLEVTVALFRDPLVLVDLQHIEGGQRRAAAGAGQVGGQGIQAVQGAGGGDRGGVAGPGDDGLAGPGAGAHLEQVRGFAGEDPGDLRVDLPAGLVVAAAQPVGDPAQGGLGLVQGALAGLADGGGFFGGPDVGRLQVMAGSVLGDGGEGRQQPLPDGALASGQVPLPPGDVVQGLQGAQAAGDIRAEPGRPAGAGAQRHDDPHVRGVRGAQVPGVAQAGVRDDDQAGRQRGGQGLDGGHERGQLRA